MADELRIEDNRQLAASKAAKCDKHPFDLFRMGLSKRGWDRRVFAGHEKSVAEAVLSKVKDVLLLFGYMDR